MDSFDVVIVGGGNAGISAAARLIRKGVGSVAIVEPNKVHTYRPLLSYVGGGEATMRDAERTQRSVTPRNCTWVEDSVVAVDAQARTVQCESGRVLTYRDLVLGPGLVPDHDALPGIFEALDTPAVASNYLDRAEQTWERVQAMKAGGRAVFTVPRPPVSCTGTTLKPLFLAADHWRDLGHVDITLVIDRPQFLGVPALDPILAKMLNDLGVQVMHSTAVTALDPQHQNITVTDRSGVEHVVPYDFLHLVPPYRGPLWLEESKLTAVDSHGLVDINPLTFQHREHPNVWAAGDAAAVDTDPSGGGLRQQISTLVENLLAFRSGGGMSEYDGYTVAPITTGRRKLINAEYDRTGQLSPTLPSFIDPLKARTTLWAFDRYGLPQVYWNLILKGLA